MSVPVVDIAQMRAWEAATWATGKTEAEVIERAGQAVADRALKLTQTGDSILILAGKGHNGDDARQAANHLAGRDARVLSISSPQSDLASLSTLLALRPALIIDGLFGIGLNRPLTEDWAGLIKMVNQTSAPILAVDVPSGLDAQTGEPLGSAICASITLTFGAPKKGLLAANAVPFVGRLEVVPEIGLVPCPVHGDLNWTLPNDFSAYPPHRCQSGHKGTYGHLVIFAGSLGYHGAAVLASRAALRARPGLVTLWTAENSYLPIASQLQSAMVHPWHPSLKTPESATCYMVGPGLAASDLPAKMKEEVLRIWQHASVPVIVDASALDWLSPGDVDSNAPRLITPHPGEAGRLLDQTIAHVQANRPAALRELSHLLGGCWVALKGHQTLVGNHSGAIYINPSGNPYLAQGGSGDVLAGYLGGLLAQPLLQTDPLKAIRFGVWQHGATADVLQSDKPNWTVESLLEILGSAET